MTLKSDWVDNTDTVHDVDLNAVATQVNSNTTAIAGKAASSVTVNGHPLTANVTVSADDVLPTQSGHSGQALTTNGTTASWSAVGAGGGYTPGGTDVAITDGGTGVSTLPSGLLKGAGTSAITAATAGTDYYAPGGTDVALADGGTGASTASAARTNLGLVIGTNVQAHDPGLDRGITSLTSSATPGWDISLFQQLNITALAVAVTSMSSSVTGTGAMSSGWPVIVRFKDNGTARAIAWGSLWRAIGVTLPTTTVANKTLYVAGRWNEASSVIDVLAVAQEA